MTFVKHRAFDAWREYLIPIPRKIIPLISASSPDIGP